MKGSMHYFQIFVCFLFICQNAISQVENPLNRKVLDSFMLIKDFYKADSTLNAQLTHINNHDLHDSLAAYPYYVGKIALLKYNAKTASHKADDFVEGLITNTQNSKTHYNALLRLADFYDEIGQNEKSLTLTKRALEIVKNTKSATLEDVGKIEYNVGATLLALGNIDESKAFFKKALTHFESYDPTTKAQLSDAYNALGATMWMSSRLDSAKYYYSKAVKTIELAKGDDVENLYLSTVIRSNISLLEYSQGNLTEAVKIQDQVILDYENVIKESKNENTVAKAKRYQARAISNLAVFYNEQGNLKKAYDLLSYSYKKKKSIAEKTDSSLASTLIQLGQSLVSLHEYDKAILYLQRGIDALTVMSDNNPYWKAAGMHALAEIYALQNNISLAKFYYDQSELLFKQALNDDYDTEFLSFLRNKSLFLAENGEPEKALDIATNSYEYVLKNGGKDNFSTVKQLINLAKINYTVNNYTNTLKWLEKADDFLNNTASEADAVQIEFNKPQLILLKASAEYELKDKEDPQVLRALISDLDKATEILEKRKTTLYKHEDISILLSDYQSITDLSKKLSLELYQKTKTEGDLEKIMQLHESGIYNRIRSRLNLRNELGFSDVPNTVQAREIQLKNDLSATLHTDDNMSGFFDANNHWNTFLDSLKTNFSNYYKMRYGTIEKSLDDLQANIPPKTTLIRYLFIDHVLYACIITKTDKLIFKLPYDQEHHRIINLNTDQLDDLETLEAFHTLYLQLWKPFENTIKTDHVIIIPDGDLFNLSFETLAFQPLHGFSEMATKSLLSKYIISYNYSLFLINNRASKTNFKKDFVVFAPEFNDQMKRNYQHSIRDSLDIDKTYLTLLPQPFTRALAQASSQLFNGEAYLNENSTETIFKNNAQDHKIIQIGTHAESNNISPELSRLIFAKSRDSTQTDDNYLYTYEIYNTNLSCNLAILTACDTGKPTHQSGEGMISLAHAFNYAGSESILTSLWKIDEQSSATIISLFYKYLHKGWAKDKALQQAKLDYMSNAEGRTINPNYWGGLVLIGDTAPIELHAPSFWLYWILGGLVVIALLLLKLLTPVNFPIPKDRVQKPKKKRLSKMDNLYLLLFL